LRGLWFYVSFTLCGEDPANRFPQQVIPADGSHGGPPLNSCVRRNKRMKSDKTLKISKPWLIGLKHFFFSGFLIPIAISIPIALINLIISSKGFNYSNTINWIQMIISHLLGVLIGSKIIINRYIISDPMETCIWSTIFEAGYCILYFILGILGRSPSEHAWEIFFSIMLVIFYFTFSLWLLSQENTIESILESEE
jgi:hypothetical protein